MLLGHIKERLIETSSIARRIYGLKLLLFSGLNDESKWFLLNKEKLKYKVKLKSNGLVLDFGGYVGEFTSDMSKLNPDMLFLIFELFQISVKNARCDLERNRMFLFYLTA
jgi:hypothetical protein